MTLKDALLAATATAAFLAAAVIGIQSTRAEVVSGVPASRARGIEHPDFDIRPGFRAAPAPVRPDRRLDTLGARVDAVSAVRIFARGRATGDGPYALREWRARSEAISDWQAKSARVHGDGFTSWLLARDKDVQCEAGPAAVVCDVSAVPVRRPDFLKDTRF